MKPKISACATVQRHVLVCKWQILLQKSAIITAKRLTAIFQALVAVCSIGSRLYAVALTPAAVTQHAQWLVLVAVGRPVWRGVVGFVRLRRA